MYVIAWFAVVFGINSTSNAEIIVRGAQQTMLSCTNTYNPDSTADKMCLEAACYKTSVTRHMKVISLVSRLSQPSVCRS